MVKTRSKPGLPSPYVLDIIPKPFGLGYFYMAAWKGQERTGPYGHGDNERDALNELVDVTEEMLSEAAA